MTKDARLRHRHGRARQTGRRHRRGYRTKRLATVSLAIVLGSGLLLQVPARAIGSAPVVLILMENHTFGSSDHGVNGDTTRYIVGNPDAPYINGTLIPQGTLSTKYYANAHPSLPNYLDIVAGTDSGCTTDSCPTDSIAVDDVFHQLGAAGISFNSFAQSMPSDCFAADDTPYVVHHNPEPYFTNIDAAAGLPYGCPVTDVPLPPTLSDPLPAFSFVIPDNCHNMHGTSATGVCPGKTDQIIRDGDAWLSRTVPAFLSQGAVVIVTFDEATKDSTGGGGHVLTVMAGSNVVPGATDQTSHSHFSLLAGLEDYFGLPRLAGAINSSPLIIPSVPPPQPPTITGFDPSNGDAGASVTIAGMNFTGTTSVRFNGVVASFAVPDDTSITTTVPSGATTGPISVSTPGGTAVSSSDFTIDHPALAASTLDTGKGGTASSLTTNFFSPTTGVVFLWVFDSLSGGTPATVDAVSGISCTWAKIQTVVSSNGHRRLSLWYGIGCSGSGTISIGLSAGAQSTIRYVVEEFKGGIDPSVPFDSANVKTAAPTVAAMSVGVAPNSLASASDAFYVGLNHNVAQDVTPLDSATEITDTNASFIPGIETNDLPNWTTGTMGGSWATSTGQAIAIGIEVRAR